MKRIANCELRNSKLQVARVRIAKLLNAHAMVAMAIALVICVSSVASLAQQPLDRTKTPAPGPNPALRVPTWTKTQLANGATLIVSERRGLPLVSFSITFVGGSNQFEPAAKRGVGAMTTSMLTEGTNTKTGDQTFRRVAVARHEHQRQHQRRRRIGQLRFDHQELRRHTGATRGHDAQLHVSIRSTRASARAHTG